MSDGRRWRQVLERFVVELRASYGERLAGVVLYGSWARGDGNVGSDIDTLILLHPLGAFWNEFSQIATITDRLSLENDVVISALPVDVAEFESGGSPFLLNARREGVRVA